MSELHLITGGAGCIGSELAAALLARGERVRVIDNLSSGTFEHIKPLYGYGTAFDFREADIQDESVLFEVTQDANMVWHLAAKTDIKFFGEYDFQADYAQNLAATWDLLKIMQACGVRKLGFASSAAVYGNYSILDSEVVIPEPISMYGATKLACEAIIRAFALRTGMRAWMFRYCSIVSGKFRNGGNMVVPDFIRKLHQNPKRLKIYGDGSQCKPSLLVSECVSAMLYIVAKAKDQVSVYNVGVPDDISVTRQAELVCEAMGLKDVEFEYTGGKIGWPGDVNRFRMDVTPLARLGWRAYHTSEEAVREAIKGLLAEGSAGNA